ncbi:hypothetical protein AMTRI_Chr03g48870 [Amborella trichopoda]
MKPYRDQIIHPMEKVPDEYELTQNPVAKESQKQNAKDCLSPRIPIVVEDIDPQKIQDVLKSEQGAENPTASKDSQIHNDGNSLTSGSKNQEKEENSLRVSIQVEDIGSQKFQDISVIRVTIKEELVDLMV